MTMWYEVAPMPNKKVVNTLGFSGFLRRCPFTGKPLGLKLPERVAFKSAHPQAHTHCLRRRLNLPAVPNVFTPRLLALRTLIQKENRTQT